jgi:DNA-binding beta-propeller fold protein YncE
MVRRLGLPAIALVVAACSSGSGSKSAPIVEDIPNECGLDFRDWESYMQTHRCADFTSCALQCNVSCAEPEKPYFCPAMRPWAEMPHADACPTWDGTYPAVTQGACTSSAPSGDAVKPFGPDATKRGRTYLPDGHWVEPAGVTRRLEVRGQLGSFALDLVPVPSSRFAVVTDAGIADNLLLVLDLDKLAGGDDPVVASQIFKRPNSLYQGLAVSPAGRVYASGGPDGRVYVFDVDRASGALTRRAEADIDLGAGSGGGSLSGGARWYAGSIALDGAGERLVVLPSTGEKAIKVVTLATKAVTSIPFTATSTGEETFGLERDPSDPSGNRFYATLMDSRNLVRIDLAAGAIDRTLPTGKNPEGIAILGAKHVAVASTDEDTITLFDAASGARVQQLRLGADLFGVSPSTFAFDESRSRLYVVEAQRNAVAVLAYDANSASPLRLAGEIPTGYWPTAVRVRADGSLVILTGKGLSSGPDLQSTGLAGGNAPEFMRSSAHVVAAPNESELAAMTEVVRLSRLSRPEDGFPAVDCKGAPSDFPIPSTNTGAPSARIEHVVFVVRENKTFDMIFGDMPGVDGDPNLVGAPGRMDDIWPNTRALARTFTNFDNYAIAAEQSLQGHVLTTHGRSTDWIERTWSHTWGRGARAPGRSGIDAVVGSPAEGSAFTWLERLGFDYDDMGEIVGGSNKLDKRYPGLVYAMNEPDTHKACYVAARARAACTLKGFSYVLMPNDHAAGYASGAPAPEVYIAVNDEATGMLVDALSRSPLWKSTLVIVTEDDPQNGSDHRDLHRTPFLMASPWVKRGYVSSTRISTASVYKMLSHVFAKPYLNREIADAAIPFDAFTSTPDYTPYTYIKRKAKAACNRGGTSRAALADSWDLSEPDEAPGLGAQVMDRMREISNICGDNRTPVMGAEGRDE